MARGRILALLVLCLLCTMHSPTIEAQTDIGVNYGLLGDNLPPPPEVIQMFQRYNIRKVRLFEPIHAVLEALRGKQIDLLLGTRNEHIPVLASSLENAQAWFNTNVQPYIKDVNIRYITVGNEVVPGQFSESILPAIQNIQQILNANGLGGIKATTVVHQGVLGASFPPSAAAFSEASIGFMTGICKYLESQNAPLLVNVYPYFAHANDPVNVRLDYALFTATEPVVRDGSLSYTNLFDAILDGFYWALEKVGVTKVSLVVSETGWPSAGFGSFTTPPLAGTYNKNFRNHVRSNRGTPKKPGQPIEGYIFAMFNENQKPAGIEQNFGLFYPDKSAVYEMF
ncbi:Glycoside hydrolase family 17 [Dillenia turbinata]|uniref:Glycoside hydrolase family 17 n=1 Tax=Dillenia turbinata TaxID=194707 RepID=A0AAN8UL41_9MAGN